MPCKDITNYIINEQANSLLIINRGINYANNKLCCRNSNLICPLHVCLNIPSTKYIAV